MSLGVCIVPGVVLLSSDSVWSVGGGVGCSCRSWIRSLVRHASGSQAVAAEDVVDLLQFRAIPAGTPVFLDEQTMRPVEPLCSWFRHLAYEDKDVKTLREYPISYGGSCILWSRVIAVLLQATESDVIGLPGVGRTQLQDKPIGDATCMGQGSAADQSALPVAGRAGSCAARPAAGKP